jgi:thiamine transport system permease protein
VPRWDADRAGLRLLDGAVIVALALFLGLPLAATVAAGVPAVVGGLPPQVWPAAGRSLVVALVSAGLAMGWRWRSPPSSTRGGRRGTAGSRRPRR